MKGVPGKAIALDLNYDNPISEDTLELSQLSNTRGVEKKNIYVNVHIHIHAYMYMQVVEL